MENQKQSLLMDSVQNAVAALTVSFAAISLGAAFGLMSERGAFAGIISAGITAVIASTFGGTRIQCSGPTAPMTSISAVVVGVAVAQFPPNTQGINSDHFINLVIILMGGLLILAAACRAGRLISFVPNVVISGFMNGIALLIWWGQSKSLFGLAGKDAYGGSLFYNFLVALATFLLIFFIPMMIRKIIPNMSKVQKLLSGTLLSIIIMSAFVQWVQMDIELVKIETTMNSWHDFQQLVSSQIPNDYRLFEISILGMALWYAVQLLFLCYLDTLLTAIVMDRKTKETTNRSKELAAQGLSGIAVSFVGGLPGAQATIRSVLLFNEKATKRWAGVLVGGFVIAEMLFFLKWINFIPQAVFVGVLFKVGWDVFEKDSLKVYVRSLNQNMDHWIKEPNEGPTFVSHLEFAFISGTTLMTLFVDLNIAVISFTVLFYLVNKVKRMPDLPPKGQGSQ